VVKKLLGDFQNSSMPSSLGRFTKPAKEKSPNCKAEARDW
jgi:hypothetical protein